MGAVRHFRPMERVFLVVWEAENETVALEARGFLQLMENRDDEERL